MTTRGQRGDPGHTGMSAREMDIYEQLMKDGIAAAAQRRSPIDHVTARRTAIWLVSRPLQPEFRRNLLIFVKTGEITSTLRTQLRNTASQRGHAFRPHAARLLDYTAARTDRGPVGPDFSGLCDQIDKADQMLAGLRQRMRDGRGVPGPTWPDTQGPLPITIARYDSASQTVSFVLDAASANIAMYAITSDAVAREAHAREVLQYSQKLPENSHSQRARQDIAARESRIADRLRAIERAYRAALDYEATRGPKSPETIGTTRQAPAREPEGADREASQ
jgi:hypothetical protein